MEFNAPIEGVGGLFVKSILRVIGTYLFEGVEAELKINVTAMCSLLKTELEA